MTTEHNKRIEREENIIFIVDDDQFTLDLLEKPLTPFGTIYNYLNINNLIEK